VARRTTTWFSHLLVNRWPSHEGYIP